MVNVKRGKSAEPLQLQFPEEQKILFGLLFTDNQKQKREKWRLSKMSLREAGDIHKNLVHQSSNQWGLRNNFCTPPSRCMVSIEAVCITAENKFFPFKVMHDGDWSSVTALSQLNQLSRTEQLKPREFFISTKISHRASTEIHKSAGLTSSCKMQQLSYW